MHLFSKKPIISQIQLFSLKKSTTFIKTHKTKQKWQILFQESFFYWEKCIYKIRSTNAVDSWNLKSS